MDYGARFVGIVTESNISKYDVAYSISVDKIVKFLKEYKRLEKESKCITKDTGDSGQSTNNSLTNLII